MTVQLWVAPAGAGKTACVVNLVRESASDLAATPRLVLPTWLQVQSLRRRLAQAGGAIGVRLLTFDGLYAACLDAAGEAYTELSEPVRYRLIRSLLDGLSYYAPLTDRPGFVHSLQELIEELKAARIHPDSFAQAAQALGGEARLAELAQVYAAYQLRLQAQGWADRAGLGWLAVEALEQRAPHIGRDWPLLAVDGFDNFTPIQVALLQILATRVGRLVVTLTGSVEEPERPLVHRRFARTRQTLEEALQVRAQPLPRQEAGRAPLLAHLEAGLFHTAPPQAAAPQPADEPAVELLAAPDRAGEVRAALRWLKARLLVDGLAIHEVALLARNMAPYRPFIQQTAAEFGLPVRLVDGLPLRANPAIAALLDLLRLMLPRSAGDPEPALPRRAVVEAWRSPYFDWNALPAKGATEPIGIAPGDADALDALARWGRVIGGQAQWHQVLHRLAERPAGRPADESGDDEELGLPAGLPVGQAAALRARFARFVQRLTPPAGRQTYRAFVQWLEALIGPDPDVQSGRYPSPAEPTALQVVACARAGRDPAGERDLAALRALKDVLRGLVWAEEALGSGPGVEYARFVDELAGALEAATYRLPIHPHREELLAADVVQARGLPFRAVAVLGLAEGEFPATLKEDPFLRNADRQGIRQACAAPLELSTESAEIEFFYETITRPTERLLLTRPRLADNGALWQASPFWEEVCHLTGLQPRRLTSETLPLAGEVASWPELLESLAAHPNQKTVRIWLLQSGPQRSIALERAALVLRARQAGEQSAHDGHLSHLSATFARQFGPDHVWSASRLETYRTCPFFFFIGRVLGLEPRPEPEEGLDPRQLGNIYHHILEGVYSAPQVSDPTDVEQLLSALPQVAAAVLDAAPQQEGFRQAAWWVYTRAEIQENVRRSLLALAELPGEFVPCGHEVPFGLQGQAPLSLQRAADRLQLRGVIDRLDRAADGRLRVIDYKTAGPSQYTPDDVAQGHKLQLPLYALAAREALGLGEPAEGFYWHVRHAEASRFCLSRFPGGPQAALQVVLDKSWEAVHGARAGDFGPQVPDGGCPSYCPAAGFCWHWRPGFGG